MRSQVHLGPKDAEKLKSRLCSLLGSRGKEFTADDGAGSSAFLLTDRGHLGQLIPFSWQEGAQSVVRRPQQAVLLAGACAYGDCRKMPAAGDC